MTRGAQRLPVALHPNALENARRGPRRSAATLATPPASQRIKSRALGWSALAGVVLAVVSLTAHHPITAKFDETKPLKLNGIVTLVDWRNPHVHVFINVKAAKEMANWAVELDSPIDLQQSGWNKDTLQPGDAITVDGISARNGSRQVWGKSVVVTGTGRQIFKLSPSLGYVAPLVARPAPRWPDKQPRLGAAAGGALGYWAYPTATALVENGVTVAMDQYGLLKSIADAPKVAPLQPWAQALYISRQRRFLQDDPTYLNCKPPGGPRQFQQPYGLQLVEDRARQRIFVLIGSGNSNFRIIYLDGRNHAGQVGGDDDNPLYYGRAVGKWETDTLTVDTRGFNEDFWFTNGGLPHSDQLRLVEKFTRTDFDTLKYEVTIEDPGAYTRSWSSGWNLRWVAGEELPRHLCQENRP